MRLDYSKSSALSGELQRMPLLPVTLFYGEREFEISGLVDSGAMMSVIPNHVGLELGLRWDDSQPDVSLGGTFGNVRAKAILIGGQVGDFPPVNFIFAWASSDTIRPILGQFNFFQEFDVHFYRSKFEFEINPKS